MEAIEVAREGGVNFFDTADVYGPDLSEELLGKAMAGRREEFVVGTKIGWKGWDASENRSQYDTVDKLVASVEESLRRLGTDYADVIQCHISFSEPNTDVFIEGFRKLKEDGKVRAWGVSTGDLSHLQRFNVEGDCDTLQIDYSIPNRIPESEVFPYCEDRSIGVIVRGPLAMGLLTGKYSSDAAFRRATSVAHGSKTPGRTHTFGRIWRLWSSSSGWSPLGTRWLLLRSVSPRLLQR